MKILPSPLRFVVTIAFITFCSLAEAQTKAVAIVGGTLIDGTGRVGEALVQQSTMGSQPVESCIVDHVRRWAFPAPQGGGTVQVTYPYVFKSSAP